ncbi:3-oxoacyl-ACP reductase [Saccharopolyspora halophila]|uniref:3-oxoacyl-ACP reductase n=1 Tax=Saccharopolyspora halophila TaxID=405551 RepID=A0ABN3G3A2_9PSEU
MSSLDGKAAIVTGAGAGLGRAEALELARNGADVVVNDVSEAAHEVVSEIEEIGTRAVAVVGDVSSRETADELLDVAVRRFGGPQVLVNNAGLLRDRMLFKMSDEEWDQVLAVHLRGHFLLSRNVSAHWRQEYKDTGATCGSIINTASEAFLLGSAGQPNYAAAKGGIAALTVSTSRAMARMGVRANAICPRARTGMTAHTFGEAPEGGVDPLSVEHVAPLVTYLAGPSARAISGQVFVVHSGVVALLAPPAVEQRFETDGPLWTQQELEKGLGDYFADRDPDRTFAATDVLSIP